MSNPVDLAKKLFANVTVAEPPEQAAAPAPSDAVRLRISDSFVADHTANKDKFKIVTHHNVRDEKARRVYITRHENDTFTLDAYLPDGWEIKEARLGRITQVIDSGVEWFSLDGRTFRLEIDFHSQVTCKYFSGRRRADPQTEEGESIPIAAADKYPHDKRPESFHHCSNPELNKAGINECHAHSAMASCAQYEPDIDQEYRSYQVTYSDGTTETHHLARKRMGLGMPVYRMLGETEPIYPGFDDEDSFIDTFVAHAIESHARAHKLSVRETVEVQTETAVQTSYVGMVHGLSTSAKESQDG